MPRTNALFEDATSRLALRGFARSIAEIEWLVLVLVMLQTVVLGDTVHDRVALVGGMVVYATFLLLHRYATTSWLASRPSLALECGVMLAFVSWSLYSAGPAGAPMANLYLLLIVTSALALGRLATAVLLFVITMALATLNWDTLAPVSGLAAWNGLLAIVIPLALVAWVTTLLAGDLTFTRGMAKDWFATDDLTALPTLHTFNRTLRTELRRSAHNDQPCSILLIDVDHLKTTNDTYGHAAGNLLLIQVGNTLSGMARTTDVPARIGGDEFAVLLPGTGAENAQQVAERVLAQLQRGEIRVEGGTVVPSVSIGIATFPLHGDDAKSLLKAADVALYQAKGSGRSRIALAGPSASDTT